MSEKPAMPDRMHTVSSLRAAFAEAGVRSGMTLLVHSRMSAIGGWICGGVEALVLALLDTLGPEGTLMVPTHSSDNTEPSQWQNPPVPPEWWDTIRAEMPAFDPATAVTRHMGLLAETVRKWPGAIRSAHPIGSFAAVGSYADEITSGPDELYDIFGDTSPIGHLYDADGYVLLLGVTHSNNTSLHLAEHRADWPGKRNLTEGTAMLVNGQRQWVTFEMPTLETDDFETIGAAFAAEHPEAVQQGQIGNAATLLLRQRPMVDYAVQWMRTHRDFTQASGENP